MVILGAMDVEMRVQTDLYLILWGLLTFYQPVEIMIYAMEH